ncbi:cytochrome P450 [Dactylosporangium matsuzakiense]|uniref:cytochrome P450 n=1 Tax=Dactylosporangium matsuzakiense TaxID=53360 RepID=UPI0021C4988D|nr:cytochrome P450 [Dactylosporangium matsuzakiense]UWZ41544.1 hypothetical protein Dmats_28245 [Dactylosporangium matsuzakiense]
MPRTPRNPLAFGNGLPVSNGAFHTRRRRLVQPAFHRERIAEYFEVMPACAAARPSTPRSAGPVRRALRNAGDG